MKQVAQPWMQTAAEFALWLKMARQYYNHAGVDIDELVAPETMIRDQRRGAALDFFRHHLRFNSLCAPVAQLHRASAS
jgi:hypothetical protein